MRLAVISAQVFPCPPKAYSGLEMIAFQCARGLSRLGHSVALFAPDGSRGDGFDMCHTGPAGIDERAAYNGYWKHLNQFHCVIDHSWMKNSYALKAEGVLKCPVLGVLHAPVDTMLSSLPPGIDKPCFVCISDDQRAVFEALFNHPARTCHNGIDLDYYKPIEGVERTDRALFLARFSTIKGADLAVRACKEVGCPLDLVGDKEFTQEPDYFRQVAALCDGEQIRMVGAEGRGGTVLRYSRAHFFIHPNQRFREPFGLAPVEAMACGLPVIAWNNGAMRETIKRGETGLLVNSYEQLVQAVRAMASPDGVPDKVRQDCRENASRLSVENMAKRYHELCNEAMSTGGW